MVQKVQHVILDRDGVLNVEREDGGYINDWSQWKWIPRAREGLVMLTRLGTSISIVTNQSGIGRGIVTEDEVDAVHARMIDEVDQAGGRIDRILICPHAPSVGCGCRKPAPGLLLEAIEASGLPRRATVVVGDDLRDMQAARSAKVLAVLVRSGKGRITEVAGPGSDVFVFDDLHTFAAATLGGLISVQQISHERPSRLR